MAEIKLHKVKAKTFEQEYGEGPNKAHLPRRRISFADLPEAEDWQNGKSYEIHEVVRQIASDENGIEVETVKIGGNPSGSVGKRYSRRADMTEEDEAAS